MARELGWERYAIASSPREFVFPGWSLAKLAGELQSKLKIRAMRVVGDANKYLADTAPWKLKTEDYLGTKLVGKLTNVSGDPSTAFFTVRFLKGTNLVANFQCSSSSELQPAQSEDIECINMSDTEKTLKPGRYDKITAEADF